MSSFVAINVIFRILSLKIIILLLLKARASIISDFLFRIQYIFLDYCSHRRLGLVGLKFSFSANRYCLSLCGKTYSCEGIIGSL